MTNSNVKVVTVTGGQDVFMPAPIEEGAPPRKRAGVTRRLRGPRQRFTVSRQHGGEDQPTANSSGAAAANAIPPNSNVNVSKKNNDEPTRFLLTPAPMPVPLTNVMKNMTKNEANSANKPANNAATEPASNTANKSNVSSGTNNAASNTANKPAANKPAANNAASSTASTAATEPAATEPSAAAQSPEQEGGANTKVIIGAKKPRHIKVILTKKRARTPDAAPVAAPQKSRKVQLGMRRLRKTVTKARKIKKTAAQLPIATIRAELVKEKIIKESSKAPEHILRQMYADAKTVAAAAKSS